VKKNMGSTDRIVRTVVALILLVLSLTGTITGVASTIAIILAVVFLLTAVVGCCPLYVPFKFSTLRQ